MMGRSSWYSLPEIHLPFLSLMIVLEKRSGYSP
uniref:Uncharacterized protein n=1 Tax=Vitis vinifera TaxID=29760 RepID=F6HTI4_VITVI